MKNIDILSIVINKSVIIIFWLHLTSLFILKNVHKVFHGLSSRYSKGS